MPPKRIKRYAGRHALVDGIPFQLPVSATNSPAFMVGFSCNWEKANALLPGNELHALKLPNGKAAFLVTVINYLETSIGKYIEFSIAIACTRGSKPAPSILNSMLLKRYGTGQYIFDLPVSSEISVKGGKGIWGMPKHQANLDFNVTERTVSSQYEKDGQFVFRIELEKPKGLSYPVKFAATNYSKFRNMLMASYIYFDAKAQISFYNKAKAKLYIGDHPKVSFLKDIQINPDPFVTLYMPKSNGILDDHFECWFMTDKDPPKDTSEGLEAVIDLGNGEEWLHNPIIQDYEKFRINF